jgi:hypothetical protein
MTGVSDVISIAGYALQVVLLIFLSLGPFRRYPIIFVYCLAQTVQMALDVWVLREFGQSSAEYRAVFWTDAIVVDLLLLLLVIALTYQAMDGNPLRSKMTRLLIVLSAIIVVLPFVVLRRPLFLTRWFNGTDQILNFGAAIMNLGLWTALLGNKKREPQLLTITAGLGVRVAAAAALLGLRHFTTDGGSAREIADMASRLSFVAGTLIWCWAFRPGQVKLARQPALKASGD